MKFWAVVGVVAVIVIAVVFAVQRGFSYMDDEQNKVLALADEAATAASANWAPEDLKPFAWSDYFSKLESEGFAPWDSYRLLGKRTGLEACRLQGLNITNGLGNARAQCPATFEKGPADILVTLSNHTGEWRVTGFAVQL
jgi:hypothetical protein